MFEKKLEIGILIGNPEVIMALQTNLKPKESHILNVSILVVHSIMYSAKCTTHNITNVCYCCLSIRTVI